MSDKPAWVEETEFKGHPTITVYTGHSYQGKDEYITMGLRKAQAVDDCIDSIRDWIDRQTGKTRGPGKSRSELKHEADRILDNAGTPPDDDIPF